MELPEGFVLNENYDDINIEDVRSDVKSGLIENNMPEGFEINNKASIPTITAAEPETMLEKVSSFFIDKDRLRARANNVYAISEATGLTLNEVDDNYEILSKSEEITGMHPGMSDEDMAKFISLPIIAATAATAPLATAAGVLMFGALDKLIPTQNLIDTMQKKGVNDDLVKLVELADFVGKGLLAKGLATRIPKAANIFMKQKITKYKLPDKVVLKPDQVRDIFQTGTLTTAEQKSLVQGLNLNNAEIRAAFKHGIDIEIPAEKMVSIVDRPVWAKVKSLFNVKVAEPIVTKTTAGATKAATPTAGLIEGKVAPKKVSVDPVKKITDALTKAESVRSKQETIYNQERAIKYQKLKKAMSKAEGESGYYQEIASLKGEMSKADFESVRSQLEQTDIDGLFQRIRQTPKLSEWDKINAMKGMVKLVGEKGVKVPTEGELKLLGEVYGEEFTNAILNMRSTTQKLIDFSIDVINLPRSLMSSMDLSAPLRQGVFLVGKQKQFFPAFMKMFKLFGSEKAYNGLIDSIVTDPIYPTARDAGLSVTDKGQFKTGREEEFLSNLAEKIPLVGHGVVASERAYIGFLNKLRFDVFKDLVTKADAGGFANKNNRFDVYKEIATFVNNATGRGTLPKGLRNSAAILNGTFFSPRLFMSRMTLMNPAYYAKATPFVRKEALKSLFSFLGIGITILSTFKALGHTVGTDPTSSDFGKIVVNNTRFDIWGGFQPFAVLAARMVKGEMTSSTNKKTYKLGEGYKATNKLDLIQRFFSSKLAPFPRLMVNLLKGTDPTGKEIEPSKEVMKMFIPLILQDIYDLYQDDPSMIPAGLVGAFGVGVQTYKPKPRKI